MTYGSSRNASAVLDSDAPVDAAALTSTFRVLFDWALDIADSLARDFQEEVDAVERVREFVHDHLGGKAAKVSPKDVLSVVSLLIGAIDRDSPTRQFDGAAAARPLRLPSAVEYAPEFPRLLI